jgi:predicted dehydrogenase
VELHLCKIGIIGLGNQSIKIIKFLKKRNLKPHYIYIRKKKRIYEGYKNLTTSLNDLEKCKIIFICTPHNTHFFYLNKFGSTKDTYLFCEKPPANNIKDLNKIMKLNYKKIYFNFNYKYTSLFKILSNTKKYNLGKLLYGNIILAHGLATKKKYFKSWRSNKKTTPLGILEILSVHFIDLILNTFGISHLKTYNYKTSKQSTNFDTSHIHIHTKCKKNVTIFNSYNSPLVDKKIFVFENGYIEQNENEINIFGPRDTFNTKGNFIKPQKIFSIKIKSEEDFNNSFNNSMSYFLKAVKDKKSFNKKLFSDSIKSNELMLSLIKTK